MALPGTDRAAVHATDTGDTGRGASSDVLIWSFKTLHLWIFMGRIQNQQDEKKNKTHSGSFTYINVIEDRLHWSRVTLFFNKNDIIPVLSNVIIEFTAIGPDLYLPLQPLRARCTTKWSPVISCHLSARPLKWPLRMRTRLWAPPIHTHSRSLLLLYIAVRHINSLKCVFCVQIDVWSTSDNVFALDLGIFLCTLLCDCYQCKDLKKMTINKF